MFVKTLLSSAALVAGAAAQFVSHASGGYSISVNIPADTASSKSGPIYFQLAAPGGTQWAGFGQGSRMSGSNMFIMYSSGSGVTVSARSASGHNMPTYNSNIQLTVLDGSQTSSDGSMIANVRCDNCLSWNGGSMDPTSSSSSWIMAYKSGNALDTSDASASIQQHDAHSSFTLDLTQGTGGTSPFAASSSSSSSASSTQASTSAASSSASSASGSTTRSSSGASTTTGSSSSPASTSASATHASATPIASSNPNTNSGSSSESNNRVDSAGSSIDPISHGVLMALLFLGFFPFFAMTLYLPYAKKVPFVHAPLMALTIILTIVGMALGITLAKNLGPYGAHQILGLIICFFLIIVQPAMGIAQHMHYRKTGGRSGAGPAHQWLGRIFIALGIVNGGLGWQLAGNTSAYVPYAVVAAIVALIYAGVVGFSSYRQKQNAGYPHDKEAGNRAGYEMHTTMINEQPKHNRI